MWELDHKESWALKNWCFQTVVLEKSLESPLDCKEIKPVNPKGDRIFIGRTDAETPDTLATSCEEPTLQKRPSQEEKGVTEDEIASPTQWAWIWANSRRQWRTGKPWVLRSMGLQRVAHDLATEEQSPINNVVIVSGEQQKDLIIHVHDPFAPKLPSHSSCHTTLSRVSCAIA